MTISREYELDALKRIGRIVARTLKAMQEAAEPGMTTKELDAIGARLLEHEGARSAPATHLQLPWRHLYQRLPRHRARHSRRPGDARRPAHQYRRIR